jgi:dehydratase
MKRPARRIGLLSLAGGVVAAATFALAPLASAAAAVPVSFDCQGKPPIGAPQQLKLDTSIQADAPATVAAGAAFEAVISPDPMQIPTEAGGFSVNNLHDLLLKVPVPANSTFVSATLTGGSGIGNGTPVVAEVGGVVNVTIPGPIAGGSTMQLPALHLNLTASGAAGSTVETKLAGTSYDDSALTFTANVKAGFFNIDVPTSCFANPSPVFTTSTIG